MFTIDKRSTYQRNLFTLLVLALAVVPAASAQTGAGTATAQILDTIQVTSGADLDVGDIVPKQVAGTVTVSSGGAVTANDAFVINPGSPATWSVSGLAGESYSITLPTSVTLLFGGTSNPNMIVNSFEHNAGVAPALDASGNDTFNVGATLNVNPNQAPGTYSRTYVVAVAYN